MKRNRFKAGLGWVELRVELTKASSSQEDMTDHHCVAGNKHRRQGNTSFGQGARLRLGGTQARLLMLGLFLARRGEAGKGWRARNIWLTELLVVHGV